ncbi:YcaO-like family protein [Achromobacter ruhlandii]|uniref:YcaO-like family protein n=1 Tax=Achromobacter ruhlandii TaxID=72557 RepID=UPI003B9EFAA2
MLTQAPITAEDLRAHDPARVCPMLAGPALIDGDTLTVRQAHGDIAIRADRALLRRAFALCDGTRSITELLESVSHRATRDRLGRFIPFLLDSGALVDASNYLLANMGFAWGSNPYGQPAPDNLSDRIGQRFTSAAIASDHGTASPATSDCRPAPIATATVPPILQRAIARQPDDALQTALDARRSTYAYGAAPVPQDALDALAWSLAGIVCGTRERGGHVLPRRTTPSAGAMHLTEVYIALLRPTSGDADQTLAPGLYRVRYPDAYRVQYELIGASLATLPRAIAKPWLLESAAGMVFLAADAQLAALRYRNRAVQYLYTEAGMALQNGALTASRQDLGFVTFGSYYEAIVRKLCGTPDHLILGSAIFGTLPCARQLAQAEAVPAIDFVWADAPSAEYTLPYYVGRAKFRHSRVERPTWGRDTDPVLACRKAVAETIERQGYCEPRDLRQAAYADLSDALHPHQVARFTPRQYRRKGFPCTPFDEHAPQFWAEAERLTDGRPIPVLADLVYSADSLRVRHGQTRFYWHSNSSGCAARATQADARLAGMLELIERDGFMRHWLAQQAGTGLPFESLPGAFQARVQAILKTGFSVSVQTLPSPYAQVAFLMARHAERRVACVSAGAGLGLQHALESALAELESRVFSLLHGVAIGRIRPANARTPDDHFDLYASPAWFHRADNLFTPGTPMPFAHAERRDLPGAQALYDGLVAQGITPLFVDITPRQNALGSGERLAVARAFAPGLVPMSFGSGMEPRGSVASHHPASTFPHPFP